MYCQHRFASSTIHRSQGGERKVVILDLTTHSTTELVRFFQDRHSERLLNVGMIRARDHLVVIGNQEMIWALAQKNLFWKRLLDRWDEISVYGADQILDEPQPFEAIGGFIAENKMKGVPSIASYKSDGIPLTKWTALLSAVESPRKLLVLPTKQQVGGAFIVREDSDSPPLFLAQGYICLPLEGGWSVTRSPNVGRVIWRIGFKHLAEEEVQPQVAEKVFQCPKCAPGKLVLKMVGGELRLGCSNDLFKCFYNRPLSLREAGMKVRLAGFKCSKGHPMTAREGKGGFVMGCENWPDCDSQTEPHKIIEGM
jgi:ssDNA-binding Zn-finger/Zn-ribbon topoisomerase 1